MERDSENKLICDDLATVGVKAKSIYDLVNGPNDYFQAIPILLKWLALTKVPIIKEGVARALTIPKAPETVPDGLIAEFKVLMNQNPIQLDTLWVFGNALAGSVRPRHYEDIVSFIINKELGDARQMMVMSFGKLGKMVDRGRTVSILLDLLLDEEVTLHALTATNQIPDERFLPVVRELTNHENKIIARNASKALKRLEKKLSA